MAEIICRWQSALYCNYTDDCLSHPANHELTYAVCARRIFIKQKYGNITTKFLFFFRTMSSITELSSAKCFGGYQKVFSHERFVQVLKLKVMHQSILALPIPPPGHPRAFALFFSLSVQFPRAGQKKHDNAPPRAKKMITNTRLRGMLMCRFVRIS